MIPKSENTYDVTIIGGGPAGLSAALSSAKNNAKTLLIEREAKLGGILKQCIHDGFGLIMFKQKLTGPEYAQYYINMLEKTDVEVTCSTFVTEMKRKEDGTFHLVLVTCDGIRHICSKTIVLATGCRERSAKQIFIHGTRPAGILTAGTAQYYTNILGQMPAKKCVILGSGDIGLIMARRLTLEGAVVEGVYEAKKDLGGLLRNYSQCLMDFNIPLHTQTTCTRVFGEKRLSAVEVCAVDDDMNPLEGSERIIECDSLILSVGLIPENELAEKLGIVTDKETNGPAADHCHQTMVDGVFVCGNAFHVNDLVDYVSLGAKTAGKCAALYSKKIRKLIPILHDGYFAYCVPQFIDMSANEKKVDIYFRSRKKEDKIQVTLSAGDEVIISKKYVQIRPSEMELLQIDIGEIEKINNWKNGVSIKMEKVE
jgi:thioredoxin reductase